jgi:hypothetical protein
MGGHVVSLPRTASDEQGDPLKLVTGEGWPEWRTPTEAERKNVRKRKGTT